MNLKWARQESAQPFAELARVLDAIRLAENGRISAVRQCAKCSKWFFARFEHKSVLQRRLQRSVYRSDAADKERRRERARTYYWLHKSGKGGK